MAKNERDTLREDERTKIPKGTFNERQSGTQNTNRITWKEIGGILLFIFIILTAYLIYKLYIYN